MKNSSVYKIREGDSPVCRPQSTPCWSIWSCPEETAAHREPTQEQASGRSYGPWKIHAGAEEKCEEKGERERKKKIMNATPIPQPSSLFLPGWCAGEGNGSEGVNMSPDQKKKKKRRKRCKSNLSSFLTTQLYFNWQKISLIFLKLNLPCPQQ